MDRYRGSLGSVEGGRPSRVLLVTSPAFRRTPGLRFRVLLAGDAEAREETWQAASTRGLKRLSKFKTTKSSELKFRAVLTEGVTRMLFHGRAFDRVDEVLP